VIDGHGNAFGDAKRAAVANPVFSLLVATFVLLSEVDVGLAVKPAGLFDGNGVIDQADGGGFIRAVDAAG
jgi:hypothetical protein